MNSIKIHGLIVLFALLITSTVQSQEISKIDSLKNSLKTADEASKPEILTKLTWKLRNLHPEEAVKYGKEAAVLAQKHNKLKELAKAYGFTGVAYRNLGNYPEAFDYYFKGLRISREHGFKTQEGYALINIGNLYIYQESYDDAINYLSKAAAIADSIENDNMSAYCNLNLGRSLLLKKDYKKAFPYFKKTLDIREKHNDTERKAVCYKYIADTYLGQKNLNAAEETYTKALNSAEITDKDLLSDIYNKLGKTYLQKHEFSKAEKYVNLGLENALGVDNKLRIKNAYKILSEINIALKRYEKAVKYQQLVMAYNDSLYNQRLSQKIANIKYSSEQEKKQAEIDYLKKEEQIKAKELQKEKRFQLILFSVIFVMLIIIILSIILSRKLKSKNALLNKQREDILKKNKTLEQNNIEIQNQSEEIATINASLKEKQELLEKSLKQQEIFNQQFFAKNLELEQGKIELQEAHESLTKQQKIIEKKNQELSQTLELVTRQQEKLQQVNKDIKSSINYAKTIQDALLTRREMFDELFKDYLLLYKPKETVSGDFYYANKIGKYLIFAVGDCTGHGVPGGFLTILGITYLHGAIRRQEAMTTGQILNILRQRIKDIFVQFGTRNQNGLDIALCAVDTETNEMQYSGAYNPLIIIRDNKLTEYKATRNPIGYYPKEKDFETHYIKLQDGDVIYIYSDGYQDQLGGENFKKFTSKRFKELLLQIHTMPFADQQELLESINVSWRAGRDQVDDIAVLGIKWHSDRA